MAKKEVKIKREVIIQQNRPKCKATITSEKPLYDPETDAYSNTHVIIEDDYNTVESRINRILEFNKNIMEEIEKVKKEWKENYNVRVE